MVRQTGRRIVVSAMCMILLFTAGCSGKNEDGGNQEQALGEVREDTAGQEEQQGKDSEPKQLKQAEKPQFIPNGIRRRTGRSSFIYRESRPSIR